MRTQELQESQVAYVLLVTPEMAAKFLANRFDQQRPIRPARVRKFAKALVDGNWCLNGQTISFSVKGQLLNGYNRMTAIVATGIPAKIWAVENVPEEYHPSIDDGYSRTATDLAGMRGYPNPSICASIARLIYSYEHNTLDISPNMTLFDFTKIYDENQRLHRSAGVGVRLRSLNLLPPRIIGFCHYEFSKIDVQKADLFFELLRTGEGLPEGHPILALRHRLMIGPPVKKSGFSTHMKNHLGILLLFKTWNNFIQEKYTLRLMTKQGEKLPKLLNPHSDPRSTKSAYEIIKRKNPLSEIFACIHQTI